MLQSAASSPMGAEEAMLMEMMKQLGGAGGAGSNALGGGDGGTPTGENWEQMLESMLGQLMSKEILYEPLQDLSKQVGVRPS